MTDTGPDGRPARRADRVQWSRERLLDVGAELIIERGYHATTATLIAERAGYSREMVRVRFGSKLKLAQELLTTEYQDVLQRPPPKGLSAIDQLDASIRQFGMMFGQAPDRLRAAWVLGFEATTSVPELRPVVDPWLDWIESGFRALLEVAVRRGEIRAIDPGDGAQLLAAAAIGGAYGAIRDPSGHDPSAPLQTVLTLLKQS